MFIVVSGQECLYTVYGINDTFQIEVYIFKTKQDELCKDSLNIMAK